MELLHEFLQKAQDVDARMKSSTTNLCRTDIVFLGAVLISTGWKIVNDQF